MGHQRFFAAKPLKIVCSQPGYENSGVFIISFKIKKIGKTYPLTGRYIKKNSNFGGTLAITPCPPENNFEIKKPFCKVKGEEAAKSER